MIQILCLIWKKEKKGIALVALALYGWVCTCNGGVRHSDEGTCIATIYFYCIKLVHGISGVLATEWIRMGSGQEDTLLALMSLLFIQSNYW
jgi:hypothetical protein